MGEHLRRNRRGAPRLFRAIPLSKNIPEGCGGAAFPFFNKFASASSPPQVKRQQLSDALTMLQALPVSKKPPHKHSARSPHSD